MALAIWTQPSNYSFGTFTERVQIVVPNVIGTTTVWSVDTNYTENDSVLYNNHTYVCSRNNIGIEPGTDTSVWEIYFKLPVENDAGVTYKVISGSLPPGVSISGNYINGTPFEVPRYTDFTFCIRATRGNEFSDRTFSMSVDGADQPEFITPAGPLQIHPNKIQYFALDSSYIDFQIEVLDFDTATGQRLSFFIADGGGTLPPGLILTDDGRLVGFIQPILVISPLDGNGWYDDGRYDSVAYDFGFRSSNGYDSYVYDTTSFDYSMLANPPKKLNRNYGFEVTVTDGDSIIKRKFDIFVVGDDYFRADNTTWLNDNGLFTADATYLRAPIWVTSSNLGYARANNYLTVFIDTYDTSNVFYNLNEVNSQIPATTLQKTISDNVAGSVFLTITNVKTLPTADQWLILNPLGGTKYQILNVESLGNSEYRLTLSTALESNVVDNELFYIGTLSILPPGLSFDVQSAELYGVLPYQPAVTKNYNFSITAYRYSDTGELAWSARMFTISVLGEVESILTWNSPSDLGHINANFVSTLRLSATSTLPNTFLLYNLTDGRLPPGLSLNLDGEIIGKVQQYANADLGLLGLTTFDFGSTTTFDNGSTTFDQEYIFTVEVRDYLGYSAISKTFRIYIDTLNQKVFSNIRTQPLLKPSQRTYWKDFINDSSIFTASNIYRPNDPSFGVQSDLSMLVFAGIETTDPAKYISAIGLNHKRKRFQFGDVKKAIAYEPGTYNVVYEVVYVQMIDPLEPNGKRLPNMINNHSSQMDPIKIDSSNNIWLPGYSPFGDVSKNSQLSINAPTAIRPDPIITIDSTGYEASNPNVKEYYPNSISNWRDNIKTVGEKERYYLPLWMRSIQPGSMQELDFQLAVPLCYCKSGGADDIILNIKFSGFDFKTLDFTADRYIIDSVEGETGDKYLVFRNDRITV